MSTTAIIETERGLRVMVRPGRPSDQAYVTSSWAISLARASGGPIKDYRDQIDRLLDHPTVRVLVACDPVDTEFIIGWLVHSPMPSVRLLHFVLVRAGSRDKHVARALRKVAGLDDARPLVWTMRGPCAKSLTAKYPQAIHQPVEEFLAP